jgi:N-hydroxyarylamine O-acetyltransferase
MQNGEWTPERLDLAAYLRRIGIDPDQSLKPDEDTLALLQGAHQASIPFENADIVLGRGIDLDLDAIQRKLVTAGRGGYCHEHNLLFAAALERIGFSVTRLTARVRAGGGTTLRPRTHMTLVIPIDGTDFLADAGFGANAPAEPIPLRPGNEVSQGRWTYRLVEGPPDGWILGTYEANRWTDLYSFGREPAHLVDYVVATHYTSTHPNSPFSKVLRVALDRMMLNGRRLHELRPEGPRPRGLLDDAAFVNALTHTFRLHLSEPDVAELVRRTAE